jgi:hypothetical protein
MRVNRLVIHFMASLILTMASLMLIIKNQPSDLFSYSWAIIIFLIVGNLIIREKVDFQPVFTIYLLYLFLVYLMYLMNLQIFPDWLGFTGPYGNGIGTDDSRFYAAITSNIGQLPLKAQQYSVFTSFYASFLAILYPFKIESPINVLFVNAIPLALLPFYSKKLYCEFFNTKKNSNKVFLLLAICPLTLSNGLILIREVWISMFLVASLYYLYKKQIFRWALFSLGSVLFRYSTITFIVIIAYLYRTIALKKIRNKIKSVLILISVVLMFIGLYVVFFNYLIEEMGLSLLGRISFIEGFIFKDDEDSVLYAISSYQDYIRIPLTFVFFFLSPYLNIEPLSGSVINIRGIMQGILAPLLFFVYYYYYIKGFIYSVLNKNKGQKIAFNIHLTYILLVLLISNYSMQIRHLTMILPFFYILVVYGIANGGKTSQFIALIFSIPIVLVNIYFL